MEYLNLVLHYSYIIIFLFVLFCLFFMKGTEIKTYRNIGLLILYTAIILTFSMNLGNFLGIIIVISIMSNFALYYLVGYILLIIAVKYKNKNFNTIYLNSNKNILTKNKFQNQK